MNRTYPKRPFLNFLVGAFLFFQKFTYLEKFGTQKIGSGYYKLKLNGNGGFDKTFGVSILENLLAAKIDGDYFLLVVSQFLLLIGNIIAIYR